MPSGKWSHHDARYNLEMVFENLLLVEDHLKIDPCANCLTKHLNLILAYAQEGRGLDNAKEVMGLFDEIDSLIHAVLNEVLSCSSGGVCNVKEPGKMQEMIQSLRRLRRIVGGAVFGIDSDIVHDIIEGKEGQFGEHAHSHEEPHEQPELSEAEEEEQERHRWELGYAEYLHENPEER